MNGTTLPRDIDISFWGGTFGKVQLENAAAHVLGLAQESNSWDIVITPPDGALRGDLWRLWNCYYLAQLDGAEKESHEVAGYRITDKLIQKLVSIAQKSPPATSPGPT